MPAPAYYVVRNGNGYWTGDKFSAMEAPMLMDLAEATRIASSKAKQLHLNLFEVVNERTRRVICKFITRNSSRAVA